MRALCASFVLAADEVWRLQGGRDPAVWRERGGDDPECIAFQEMAHQGHYGPGAGSKQGVYVCTPSGAFLASVNSNDPRDVAAMLGRGLEAWRALPAEERARAPGNVEPKHRFESSLPRDGLVLFATVRDLPDDGDPTADKHFSYNHDRAWFTKAEARRFLAPEPREGAVHTLPPHLFERLARFHLVDAVRGETRAFRRGDVDGELTTEVTAIGDGVVELALRGASSAEGRPWRRRGDLYAPAGIRTEMLGRARYDLEAEGFVSFELVATGVRWTFPPRRPGRRARRAPVSGIGWFFELVPTDTPDAAVAPTKIRQYGVDWVR